MARNDLQGTLDLLVLKTLSQMGELHGYGIVLHIQRASEELLTVEEGSLYPALHRMEMSGSIRSSPCGAGRDRANPPRRSGVPRTLFGCAARFRSRAALPSATASSKRGGREFPEDHFLPCGAPLDNLVSSQR